MKKSLVLTTYNGQKYILEQLESIRCQTEDLDEVLIFDDGSTDGTPALVTNYIQENRLTNWHYSVNKTNKGWRRNFMDGLCAASGDIVFLADQDDIWMQEKIELMSQAMEDNDNIQLLVCNYQTFYDEGLPDVEKGKVTEPFKKDLYPNIFNVLYPGCTYCARKELIHEAKEYWTEDTAHDELLWRIALFNEALYVYPQKLIYWRRHKDSSWSIEGARNKTLDTRLKWTAFAKGQVDLLQVILEKNNQATPKKEQILSGNLKWIVFREKLFREKSVATVFQLLPYTKYYNSFKQYLGDIYLTFLKK